MIKLTIEYTSGVFRGHRTTLYLRVYKRFKPVPVYGSGYRIISEERVK